MLVSVGLFARFARVRAHFSPDSCGTNWAGHQIPHPHQVVRRRREREHPSHLLNPAMPHLAHQRDRLQPAEALFDPLPLLLADRVSGMPRRPLDQWRCLHSASCSAPRAASRSDSGIPPRNPAVSYPLSAPTVTRCSPGNLLQHHQRRIALRRAVGLEHFRRSRSVRCGSPSAGSRCSSAWLPCRCPCAPAARPGSVVDSCVSLLRFSP